MWLCLMRGNGPARRDLVVANERAYSSKGEGVVPANKVVGPGKGKGEVLADVKVWSRQMRGVVLVDERRGSGRSEEWSCR